jgi:hypothetical protein
LLNKLDELSVIIKNISPDVIALTETWLNDDIIDSVCDMSGYSIVRKDRMHGSGGGVLLYIRNGFSFRRLDNLINIDPDFEILFVSVRPPVLPRPLSIIVLAVLYCPPWYNADKCKKLCDFICDSFDRLSRHFSYADFYVMGDFNHLNTSLFNKHLCLKQLISKPTRGNNILDNFFY